MENKEKFEKNDGFSEIRRAVLAKMLTIAPFDGWTHASLAQAGQIAGVSESELAATFPRGVGDILKFWSAQLDNEMLVEIASDDFHALKIREKVTLAIEARLECVSPHKEAARRAAAFLAMAPNTPLGTELTWATADAIWRHLGDTSTDFNCYSKRGVLSGVLVSTNLQWFADDGDGERTKTFIRARIENVMQFEKAKASVKKVALDPAAIAGWFAKQRYR